ncbi:hypothetical protein AB0E63_08510 [Kribbella sp. NPDC026596]|uniref:hypothetical protein n=1 Tax=Kribbella sp. NPDC026596 TaxID=3155122 RepID=UPI0033C32808
MRDLPYATNAAHDADALRAVGRGDCLAKSALLIEELERIGLRARQVRWRYLLPEEPVEVRLLPSRHDVHSAVQVQLGERWTLVDATHDPLLSAKLTVADWDGSSDTPPAYEPVGPIWIDGQHDAEIRAEIEEITRHRHGVSPRVGPIYQRAFNRWLDGLRSSCR